MRPVHIEHPHFGEMLPLREINPNPKTSKKEKTIEVPRSSDAPTGSSENKLRKTMRATPESVAEALSELSDLDFTRFYGKKSDRAHQSQSIIEL